MRLPEPLANLNHPPVVEAGEVTIPWYDMTTFFDPVVEDVSEAIQSQIYQLQSRRSVVQVSVTAGDHFLSRLTV
jgi:hypothetical protein